ncbi:MAG: sugar transferase [Gemmataceae bacterium]|nr:sugar transferase [Gemmataceae bacterium]
MQSNLPLQPQSQPTEPTTVVHAARRRPGPSWYAVVKAVGDWLCALMLLALTAPLILLAVLAVKLTSRGPVFYSQTRLGRNGRPYAIYKIRTMYHNCERQSGACWSVAGDPRVTPVGRFLRATHLDELPQLWNVLRGEMSLVGPRPERPEFVPELEKAVPRYRERMRLRPGVTGLAQIQLPPDVDVTSVRRKLAHDLYYAEHMGFWLDLRILLSTALKFVGVPWGVSRTLLRVPGGKPVERAYERSVAPEPGSADSLPALASPELQPA